MAATMPLRDSATILAFRKNTASVERTDRKNRLPTLSSAEIDSIFDHALLTSEQSKQAA